MKKILIGLTLILISFNINASNGKDIFERYCTVCHAPSMAPMFGSPAAHDIDAWNERKEIALQRIISEDSSAVNLNNNEKDQKILKNLVESAMNGTDKGMPPMGTCMDCSEDDLKSAIEFMSSK